MPSSAGGRLGRVSLNSGTSSLRTAFRMVCHAGTRVGMIREFLRASLARHVAIQSHVRAKNLAHPAHADGDGDRVQADRSSRVHSLSALLTLFIFQQTGESESKL